MNIIFSDEAIVLTKLNSDYWLVSVLAVEIVLPLCWWDIIQDTMD